MLLKLFRFRLSTFIKKTDCSLKCAAYQTEQLEVSVLHMYCGGYEKCLLVEVKLIDLPVLCSQSGFTAPWIACQNCPPLDSVTRWQVSLLFILPHVLASRACINFKGFQSWLKCLPRCALFDICFVFVFFSLCIYRHTPELQHIYSHLHTQGAKS